MHEYTLLKLNGVTNLVRRSKTKAEGGERRAGKKSGGVATRQGWSVNVKGNGGQTYILPEVIQFYPS